MKRIYAALVLLGIIVIGGVYAPAVNAKSSSDNFTVQSFDVDMKLGQDSEKRSTLDVKETVTAQFPSSNSSHGLEQVFVKRYDGHDTHFTLKSVTDENDKKLTYHWQGDSLRIGEKSSYAHGSHTYVIHYTQRDVTKMYNDTKKQEFYWDVIGTEWRIPIRSAHVTLTVDSKLRSAVQSDVQCYKGHQGANNTCHVYGSSGTYTVSERAIGSGKGLTIALGFTPDTFASYTMTFTERMLYIVGAILLITNTIGLIVALILAFVLAGKYRGFRDANKVNKAIIPEYTPPRDHALLESSYMYAKERYDLALTSVLLNAAVRGYIEICEMQDKGIFKSAKYELRIKKLFTDINDYDQAVLTSIFGSSPNVGDVVTTDELQKSSSQVKLSITSQGYRVLANSDLYEVNKTAATTYHRFGVRAMLAGLLTLSLPVFVVGFVGWSMAGSRKRIESTAPRYVTKKGAEFCHYLDGLKLYIGVAESDRIKMLQAPETAEKIGIDTSDKHQVLKLYEKLLPYAVLFGQEKEWTKQLGVLYSELHSDPGWTTSSNGTMINAAAFSGMVSSFQGTMTSASGYSSSSGGSGGGGFSGGGGGGGGGGGW